MEKLAVAILLFALYVNDTMASVIMNSTRIIYKEGARDYTLKLKNNDNFSNLVQMWVGDGSGYDNEDNDFSVIPSLVKIGANKNQVVRLIYTGKELPPDRETLFISTHHKSLR